MVRPFLPSFLGEKFTDPIDGKSAGNFSRVIPKSGRTYWRQEPFPWNGIASFGCTWKNEPHFSKALKVLHFAPEQAFLKRFRNSGNPGLHHNWLLSPIADVKADICDLPSKTISSILSSATTSWNTSQRYKSHAGTVSGFEAQWNRHHQVPWLKSHHYVSRRFHHRPKKRTEIFGQYDHVKDL